MTVPTFCGGHGILVSQTMARRILQTRDQLSEEAIRGLNAWGKPKGGGMEGVQAGRGTNILLPNDHQQITNKN